MTAPRPPPMRGPIAQCSTLLALLSQRDRPVAIDLSDLSDELIESIDLIRIFKNVSLRYVAGSHSLVLHIE